MLSATRGRAPQTLQKMPIAFQIVFAGAPVRRGNQAPWQQLTWIGLDSILYLLPYVSGIYERLLWDCLTAVAVCTSSPIELFLNAIEPEDNSVLESFAEHQSLQRRSWFFTEPRWASVPAEL